MNHRLECEARYWLTYPLKERRAWLEKIEKIRGLASTEALKKEMQRQFEKGKQ
jgi:hypothetical protein